MKILMVTTSYPRFCGDAAGIFVERACIALVKAGIKVTVLAPNDEQGDCAEVRSKIVIKKFNYFFKRYQKIAYGFGGILVNLRNNKLLFLVFPFFLLSFIYNIFKESKNCDLIHANWLINGFLCLIPGKINNKPIILTLRGEDVKLYIRLKSVLGPVLPWLLGKVSAFSVVSKAFYGFLLNQGVPSARIYFIPNGVARIVASKDEIKSFRKSFDIRKTNTNILFVGSLIERKGVKNLIEGLKLLSRSECLLIIVGSGHLICELKQLCKKLDIEKQVLFAGAQQPSSIHMWYYCADIFVLPSLFEGRPNVILEAFAHQVPTIATNIDGSNELVIDKKTGLLCDPDNSKVLANKILQLIDNDKLREKLIRGGTDFLFEQGLTWDLAAVKYIDLYKKNLRSDEC